MSQTAKEIIEWVSGQKKKVNRKNEDSVIAFTKDLCAQIEELNFKLAGEKNALGYAGTIGDTGIFMTVGNICENSDGKYGFINDVAGNILNTKVDIGTGNSVNLWESVAKVVGPKYANQIFGGKFSNDGVRSPESFEGRGFGSTSYNISKIGT